MSQAILHARAADKYKNLGTPPPPLARNCPTHTPENCQQLNPITNLIAIFQNEVHYHFPCRFRDRDGCNGYAR